MEKKFWIFMCKDGYVLYETVAGAPNPIRRGVPSKATRVRTLAFAILTAMSEISDGFSISHEVPKELAAKNPDFKALSAADHQVIIDIIEGNPVNQI